MQRWLSSVLHGKKGSADQVPAPESYATRSSSGHHQQQPSADGPLHRGLTSLAQGTARGPGPAPTHHVAANSAAAAPQVAADRGSVEGDPRVAFPSLSGGIPARSSLTKDSVHPSSPTGRTAGPTANDMYLYGRPHLQAEDGPTQPLLMPSQHKPFLGFGHTDPSCSSLGIHQQDTLLPAMMVPGMQHSMLAGLSSSPIASAAKLSHAIVAGKQQAAAAAAQQQQHTVRHHHHHLQPGGTLPRGESDLGPTNIASATHHPSAATPATAGSPLGVTSQLSSYHSLTSADQSSHGQNPTAPWTSQPPASNLGDTGSFTGGVSDALEPKPDASPLSHERTVIPEEDPLAVWSVLDESVGHGSGRGAALDTNQGPACTMSLFDDASVNSYAKQPSDGAIPRHWLVASAAAAATNARAGSQHSQHSQPRRLGSGPVQQASGAEEAVGGGHSRTSSQLTSVHAPSLADLMQLGAACPSQRPSLRHLDSLDVYVHQPNSNDLSNPRFQGQYDEGSRGRNAFPSGGLSGSHCSRSRSKHTAHTVDSNNAEQLLSLGIHPLAAEASTPVMQATRQQGRIVSFDLLEANVPVHSISQTLASASHQLHPPSVDIPEHMAMSRKGSLGPPMYSIAMSSAVQGDSNHPPSTSYATQPFTQGATSIDLSVDRSTNNTVLASSLCLATTSANVIPTMSSAPLPASSHQGLSNLQWLQEYLQSLGEDSDDKHVFVAHRHMRLPCIGLLGSFLSFVHGIRAITLVHAGIDDAGAVELAIGLRQSYCELWVLDLRHNRIGNKGAAALAGALRACSSLRELVLSNNLIGDEGVQSFTEILTSAMSPQRVRLSHNPASQESLKALAAAYKGCRQRRARSRRSMLMQQMQEQQDSVQLDTSNSPPQGIFDNVLGSDEEPGTGSDPGPPTRSSRSGNQHNVTAGMAMAAPSIAAAAHIGPASGLSCDPGESPSVAGYLKPHASRTLPLPAPVPAKRLNALMDVDQIQALIKVLFAPTLPEEHVMAQDVGAALINLTRGAYVTSGYLTDTSLSTSHQHSTSLSRQFRTEATISLTGIADGNSSFDMAPTPASGGMVQASTWIDLDSLAAALTAKQHDVVVVTSTGGGAGGECLQNLRHKYLTVYLTANKPFSIDGGFDMSYDCHSPVWSTHMTDLQSDMVSLSGFSVAGADDLASGPVTRNASTCSLYAAGLVPATTSQNTTPAAPGAPPPPGLSLPPQLQQTSPSQPLPNLHRKSIRMVSYDGIPDASTQLGLFEGGPGLGIAGMGSGKPPTYYRSSRASMDGSMQLARPSITNTDASNHGDPSTGRASRGLAKLTRPESNHGLSELGSTLQGLIPSNIGAQLLRHHQAQVQALGKSRNSSAHGGMAYEGAGLPSRGAHHVGSTAAQTIPELGSYTGSRSERLSHAGPGPIISSPSTIRLLVDPGFKEQFEIGKNSTARYDAIMAVMPSVYVGQEHRLPLLVELLCEEMAAAFKEHGLPIPPWRRASSMMSKWKQRNSMYNGSVAQTSCGP